MSEHFREIEAKWLNTWKKHAQQRVYISLKCGINTGYATIYNLGIKRAELSLLPSVILLILLII